MSPTRIRSTSTRSLRGLVALSLVLLANGAGPGAGPVAASALDPPTTTLADSTPPLGSVELPPAPGDSSLQATPDPLALRGDGRPRPTTASWKAAKAGVSDLFYLYTTPLRMSGLNVLETGAVLGTGVALYSVDGEIESGFRRSRENGVYRTLVIDAGGALEPLGLVARTNGWLAGAAVAGWVFDVPLLRTIPVEMIESNLIVGALRQPLQRLSRRSRPSDDAGSHSFGGGQSFPSGHSSVVCEYAAILSHHFRHPAARASIWSVAGLVCLQRIDDPDKSHWPSDVWFGAALGAYSGHTLARRNDERRRGVPQRRWYDVAHRSAAEWSITPTAEPVGFTFHMKF